MTARNLSEAFWGTEADQAHHHASMMDIQHQEDINVQSSLHSIQQSELAMIAMARINAAEQNSAALQAQNQQLWQRIQELEQKIERYDQQTIAYQLMLITADHTIQEMTYWLAEKDPEYPSADLNIPESILKTLPEKTVSKMKIAAQDKVYDEAERLAAIHRQKADNYRTTATNAVFNYALQKGMLQIEPRDGQLFSAAVYAGEKEGLARIFKSWYQRDHESRTKNLSLVKAAVIFNGKPSNTLIEF